MSRLAHFIADDDESKLFVKLADGRVFSEPTVILVPSVVERIRQGYMCIWCFEPFETSFPKECSLCGFPVSDMQMHYYGKMYAGVDVPPASWDEKLGQLDQDDEKKAHVKGSMIQVPNGKPR